MKHSGEKIINMAKDCAPHGIKHVAAELFSDGITTSRLAFFIAFVKEVFNENPHSELEIYRHTFNSLYSTIKF